jgi:hypothetical protein
MADATVNIIIKATDKASATLKGFKAHIADLNKAVPGLSGAFSVLVNPLTLATAGIAAAGATMRASIKDTMEYGLQVRDLSRNLGISTEEASRLIQVSDDLRVDMGTLKVAFRTALKDGIVPSIDGLVALSAEYQRLESPAEKAKFAMDKFGRSGLEMQKILEKTPEQLREMAKELDGSARIMSEKSVKAAEDYWKAMDDLNDKGQELKITIGNALIPTLTEAATTMVDLVDVNVRAEQTEVALKKALEDGIITRQQYKAAMDDVFTAAVFGKVNVEELAKAEEYLRLNVSGTAEAMSVGMGDLKAYEAGIRSNTEAANEAAEANSRVAISITEVSKTSAAKTAIDILTAAYKADAIEADVYAVKMSDIMRNWLDMPMAQVTASIAIQTIQEDLDDGKISALEASAAILGVGAAADAINGKSATVTVDYVTNYTTSGAPLPSNPKAPQRKRALGGLVYKGQAYVVGENRAEMFVPMQNGRIIPNVTNNYGANNNAEVIAAIRNNRLDEARLARLMRDQFAKVAG